MFVSIKARLSSFRILNEEPKGTMEWEATDRTKGSKKRRKKKASGSLENLESPFEEIDLPCVITDRSGRIITWNLPNLLDKKLLVIVHHL